MNAELNDVIDRLRSDARRLRLGQRLPAEGALTADQVRAVHADFLTLLDQPGVTIDLIDRALAPALSRGPLSRFKNMDPDRPDTFVGNLDKTVRTINGFIELLGKRAEAKRPDGFVETEAAKRMLAVIQHAVTTCTWAIITSDAGRGKTMTMQAAKTIYPGSLYVRVLQSTRRPSGLSRALVKLLGIRGVRDLQAAEANIIDALAGTGRALLIDEAHRLTEDALEFIRDIHDTTGVPIVMAGTVKLLDAVTDATFDMGQFTSRVGIRYNLADDLGLNTDDPRPIYSADDIRRLYETDQLRLTPDALSMLARLAGLPGLGGLRLAGRVVEVARTYAQAAATSGGGMIDAATLMKVLKALHGRAYSSMAQRALDRTGAKVRTA